MFTLQQVKAAHAKVKSGADFPEYIREIKELGLKHYEFSVADGSIVYYGNNHQVTAPAIYQLKEISKQSSPEVLKHNITIHQHGQTDFIAFCNQAAAAGVEKWLIDTDKMLCTYYNLAGDVMVAEPIPQGDY